MTWLTLQARAFSLQESYNLDLLCSGSQTLSGRRLRRPLLSLSLPCLSSLSRSYLFPLFLRMSSLSTASKDSHEFVLLPTEPAPSTLVQISTQDHSTPLPPSTPRPPSPRKLVKRSLPVEDGPISHSPPLAPSSPPIGHSRRGSAGSPGARSSSSRERSPPIIAPHESLVGDVQMVS